jgi:hypothetical protein
VCMCGCACARACAGVSASTSLLVCRCWFDGLCAVTPLLDAEVGVPAGISGVLLPVSFYFLLDHLRSSGVWQRETVRGLVPDTLLGSAILLLLLLLQKTRSVAGTIEVFLGSNRG